MKLLIVSSIIFLFLSSVAFAQTPSFKDKVLISPDVAFLWNFQRGIEEMYRFIKFSSTMRVDYSLDLAERRIGEMEVLANKSETDLIPMVENEYEVEIDKVGTEMNSTDIFSEFTKNLDVKQNVTERLQYDVKVLDSLSKEVTEPTKTYLANAMKKTSICMDSISRL